MRRLCVLTAALAVAGFVAGGAAAAELEVGDVAPPFELPGSDGNTHTLAQYEGKDGGAGVVPQGLHRWLNGRVRVAA